MTREFYSSLCGFVLRRRWSVIIGYLLLTAALGWVGSRITLKADITDLLPEGDPSGDDLRFYLREFGATDPFFFSLTRDGPDDDEALEEAASSLAAKLAATGLVRDTRYGFSEEEGIDAARRAMAHLPVLVPAERMEDLRQRLSPEGIRTALARLKSRSATLTMAGPRKQLASEDPLALIELVPAPGPGAGAPVPLDPASGLFLSQDGASLLLLATPRRPPQDMEFSKKLLRAVENVEAEMAEESAGITIAHAGGHLFAVQDEARIRHDIASTVSLSLGAIATLFALILRRLRLLLILLVPLTLSTLWTLGVAAIYPGHLNVVTVAFAAILLGMGDDSLTHLYLRFREETAGGLERAAALRAALGATGPSILLATLTSGLAFASLTFVQFRGLSELGLIAAIGMVNLLVSVLFLFPAMLSLGPPISMGGGGPALPGLVTEPIVRFHRWGVKHRPWVLAAAAAVVLVAGAACARLQFTSDIKALRGADPAQESLDSVLRPFGGIPDPIHLIREGSDVEQALEAAGEVVPLCGKLRDEGLITGCSSVTSWLPPRSVQRARFDALSSIPWSAAAAELRAEAERMDLRAGFFAPFLANLARYGDWEAVRMDPGLTGPEGVPAAGLAGSAAAVSLFPVSGRTPSEILARARRIEPRLFDPETRVASVGLAVERLASVIQADFRRASLIALIAVAAAALAAFRSAARLLLVAVPVISGSLLMLGGLAALGIPINLMNLVATPLVFGLGIHFGVYIVHRHLQEGGADVPKVLRHTGGAIALTGLTTIAGFGSLLSAEFAGLRSMGWVVVLGIGGCLAAALLILPLLLHRETSGSRRSR